MCLKICLKSFKLRKKVDNGLFSIKKVNKDAIVPINVKSFLLFLDKPGSYTTVDLIFYAPNVANLIFLMIVPTIALKYRQLHYSTEKV